VKKGYYRQSPYGVVEKSGLAKSSLRLSALDSALSVSLSVCLSVSFSPPPPFLLRSGLAGLRAIVHPTASGLPCPQPLRMFAYLPAGYQRGEKNEKQFAWMRNSVLSQW
jgi:hypothetical protein